LDTHTHTHTHAHTRAHQINASKFLQLGVVLDARETLTDQIHHLLYHLVVIL
jgi:hypothetical protein